MPLGSLEKIFHPGLNSYQSFLYNNTYFNMVQLAFSITLKVARMKTNHRNALIFEADFSEIKEIYALFPFME